MQGLGLGAVLETGAGDGLTQRQEPCCCRLRVEGYLELGKRHLPGLLRLVPMQCRNFVILVPQLVLEGHGLVLGLDEDEEQGVFGGVQV